jgi:hypothetical protein
MADYIGLELGNIPGTARCMETSPMNGAQCILEQGHDGEHRAPGIPVDAAPHACPDCGGPMAEFTVDAPSEEMALRVFNAYYATLALPDEDLEAVREGKKHIHVVDGKGCME